MMAEAHDLWDGIGRPLDAAISDLLLGHALAEARPEESRKALARAEAEFERLGVAHLAALAKTVA
jgi:hypothetical protein